MPEPLVLNPADTVAILTEKGIAPAGHKIARTDIAPGTAVVKYGQTIGYATESIAAGAQALGQAARFHGLTIQGNGGTRATVRAMLPQVGDIRRAPAPASALKIGLQCGGSDGFSGITANPALGVACDLNCGDILSRGVPLETKAREIVDLILATASGRATRSEDLGLGDHEFVPWRIGAVV